jgi:RecB family exonuclease
MNEARSAPLNSSFSLQLPELQLAVDSTSLGTFKECPRKYYYSIVLGLQPRELSPHLTFGLLLHEAREKYEIARSAGAEHQEALRESLRAALGKTWNQELGRGWQSNHKLKNRLTLVQTLVWYLDEFGEKDQLQTVQLANGKPAIELSFRLASGFVAQATGEEITFCGHLDRIAKLNEDYYIVDIKTTGSTLSPSFFADFTPGNQFSMYCLAGRVGYEVPVRGVIVDAVQVAIGFSRFLRGLVQRSVSQLDEWLEDTGQWLARMNEAAERGKWPQNDKACHHYGGCQFRGVCARAPGAREVVLKSDFKPRIWDPLHSRGEG